MKFPAFIYIFTHFLSFLFVWWRVALPPVLPDGSTVFLKDCVSAVISELAYFFKDPYGGEVVLIDHRSYAVHVRIKLRVPLSVASSLWP